MDEPLNDKIPGKGDGADIALNLSTERDRALLRRAVNERWPMPMEKRKKIAEKLLEIAAGEDAKADSRSITSAARTLARMDALNQADEHAERHYQRIDEGQPTERVEGILLVDDLDSSKP